MSSFTLVDRKSLPPWQEVLAPYSLGYRIKILSQLLSRQLQERLEPYGLTSFHWVVLCCLWQQDGLSASLLSEKLNQVGATLTGVLDRMEERGFIWRERDRSDRRIWRIWLTEAGWKLQEVLPGIVLELREQALAGISATDREHFSQVLDRVITNLTSD